MNNIKLILINQNYIYKHKYMRSKIERDTPIKPLRFFILDLIGLDLP